MLLQTWTIVLEKGNMEGLLEVTLMINKAKKEHEEVVVMLRWESLDARKNREKSDAPICTSQISKRLRLWIVITLCS